MGLYNAVACLETRGANLVDCKKSGAPCCHSNMAEKQRQNILKNQLYTCTYIFISAPLGSIPELPAQSCQEIKASEGKDTISDKYWLDPAGNGTAVLIYCDMNLAG